jgi:signal transduction histidine kinase
MGDGGNGHAIGRRRTWLFVGAALLPLLVLLALQYRWLVRLEHVSTVAHRATLDNYLEAVASGVELHYRALGERALNLPVSVFVPERPEKIAYHFEKKGVEGAGRLFAVSLVGESAGQPLVFDPATRVLATPPWSAEMRAVYVAIAPWRVMASKRGTLERPALHVEERDPEHRMILNPITDESGLLVGLAGLLVDREHFERTALPRIVAEALPRFFASAGADLPVVTVRDGAGRRIDFGERPDERPEESVRPLGFLFGDYEIGIRSRHRTAAAWARRNFELNLALSVLLAAVVAGGVLFALRAAAREMRLSEMKSDFVSNVSHELRTPLASIRVFGELLRLGRAGSEEKVREYGELIETESRRLTGLIDNILDLARIESGRKSYELEPADLEDVVAETLRTFRVSLAPSGFRIAYRAAPEALPPLDLDARAIAQAIGNLLDNAAKYSGDARDIEVGVRREGSFAVVWVADRGVGVPRAEQEKIFDRFHRVATGLVHDVKGSGLGLAIVRHVAEAHGGRIELESRPGAGSTFSLRLPLPGADVAAARMPAPGERPSEA